MNTLHSHELNLGKFNHLHLSCHYFISKVICSVQQISLTKNDFIYGSLIHPVTQYTSAPYFLNNCKTYFGRYLFMRSHLSF